MSATFQSSATRLRRIGDGGPGFCAASDPDLFRFAVDADTPLLVALDTNILIDLVSNAGIVLDDEPAPSSPHGKQLDALGSLINSWMVRDIRFVPLRRSIDDSGRRALTGERASVRRRTLDGVASALSYQTDDWEWDWMASDLHAAPAFIDPSVITGHADRELVEAASALRCDVFLTQDKRVLAANGAVPLLLLSPVELAQRLDALPGDGIFGIGGIADHPGCRYAAGQYLMGDMGKIAALLEAIPDADSAGP